MPKVVGIKFRTTPRVYYFAPKDGETYKKGDTVVVETQRGVEFATVALPEFDVEESKIVAPLKVIERRATEKDMEAYNADLARKQEIIATAKDKVAVHNLDMKIVDCEFTADHGKLVLYFTAEQRIDFRELVRDLASAFHMRIDLRQIGTRDECKLIGSLGACGMPCCCKRFESDSEHVSIKMAKNQGLALNPGKINGMCGRLMCCLSYENKTYDDILKRMPKHGVWVTAPDGRRGTVVSTETLAEKVRVRFGDDENFEFADFPLEELSFEKRRDEPNKPNKQSGEPNNRGKQNNRDRQNNNGKSEDRGGKKPRDKNAQPQPSQQSQNDERGERKSRGFKNKNRNKNRDKQNDKNKEGGAREEQ